MNIKDEYLKLIKELEERRARGNIPTNVEDDYLDKLDALWYKLTNSEMNEINDILTKEFS